MTARVEVDGREEVMVFLTNNLGWNAWTVAELYGARWDIKVFFKEIKLTVQPGVPDFHYYAIAYGIARLFNKCGRCVVREPHAAPANCSGNCPWSHQV